MNSISATVQSFVDDVAAMVEPLTRRRRRRAPVTLVERAGGYECYRNGRRGPALVASGDLADFARARLPREMLSKPIEVRLDGSRVLSRTLQLPAASRDYLDAIVTHQLERMTPWTADRVVFDYTLAEGEAQAKDQVAVRLVATSRDVFDATMARLAQAGVKAAVVGTSEDPLDQPSTVNLLHTSRSERRKALRRRIGAALAVLLLAGVVASGFTGWRLFAASSAAAALQGDMDAARAAIEAAVARTQTSEGIERLVAQKEASVPMVVLLDQVSRLVPASTYLTELEVEGEELRIAGLSSEAPALIGILEAAETLADVRFAAATTRGEGGTLDRFEIVARILAPGAAEPASTGSSPDQSAGDPDPSAAIAADPGFSDAEVIGQ